MRLRLVAVAAVATAVVAGGCSGDGGGSTGQAESSGKASPSSSAAATSSAPTSAPSSKRPGVPAGDKAVAWTNGFCGALSKFAGLADIAPPKFGSRDVAGAKRALSDYFGRLSGALGSTLDELKNLPPSPVPQGDQAKKALIDAFTPAQQQVAAAKRKLDAAPDNDPQALIEATKGLQGIGSTMNDLADPLRGIQKSPKLAAAAQQAPNCRKLGS